MNILEPNDTKGHNKDWEWEERKEGKLTEGETETEGGHELLVSHDNAHRAYHIHSPCS